jgi:hypothetical protein
MAVWRQVFSAIFIASVRAGSGQLWPSHPFRSISAASKNSSSAEREGFSDNLPKARGFLGVF